jgi:hypothetical protein
MLSAYRVRLPETRRGGIEKTPSPKSVILSLSKDQTYVAEGQRLENIGGMLDRGCSLNG